MCPNGLGVPNGPKLSLKGSQETTTSQKRSRGRHLVSHLLRGQNEGSTNMPLFGRDHECKECK